MIGFFLALIIILAVGLPMGIFKFANYRLPGERSGTKLNLKLIIKAAAIVILAFVVSAIQPIEVQRINAGSVGLKIDRFGNSKGVPIARPCKGWVFYNSWVTDVVEYSIGQNHAKYDVFTVTTKGGFPLNVKPEFNYALKPDKAADLYINLLKGNYNFSSLEDNFLKTATELSLNNASNKYPIDSIFNDKQGYNKAVADELNRELAAYFTVSQINPGTVAPPELKEVIIAKTNAIQKAQQAELDKITAIANAQTKIENAKGDSAEKVINAAGEAEAIKLKTREVSPTYVEYIKWLNAGPEVPRVPSTTLGSNTGYLIKQ